MCVCVCVRMCVCVCVHVCIINPISLCVIFVEYIVYFITTFYHFFHDLLFKLG